MEQSKNKRANNILVAVIALSIVAIVVISMFTMASKRGDNNPDSVADSTITSDSQNTINSKNSEDVKKDADTKESSSATESKKEIKSSESKAESKKEEVKSTVKEEKETFILPVSGSVTKEFSIDTPVFSITMNDYRAHTGIDISCEEGSPVAACAGGVIKNVVNDPMMGTTITIEHADGIFSSYMNLNETLPGEIKVGAVVEKGQLIGAVGNSAIIEIASEPHLHFEMTQGAAYVNPLTLLDASSISVMSENITE